MIATQNQTANDTVATGFTDSNVQTLNAVPALVLPNRIVTHHPKAGLNPIVDAASYLFSILSKLKQLNTCRHLNKLQKELMDEVAAFQETIKNHGYSPDYIAICRYVVCATLDDILINTAWGAQGQWEAHLLLNELNTDSNQPDKFFNVLERIIKEPKIYIDLMELMYICLSLGYKGQLRSTEHNQFQLEQITTNLFKHIRSFRGKVTKSLSPTPLKSSKTVVKVEKPHSYHSYLFIFFVTACVIMAIFVSLGYLMDVISNEAYQNMASSDSLASTATPQQTFSG